MTDLRRTASTGPSPDSHRSSLVAAARRELDALRASIRRNRPFGHDSWMIGTARTLGLEASLRPVGRPRKQASELPTGLFTDADSAP